MDELLHNLLIVYFIGFFTTIGVSAITGELEIGFRTRVLYSAVWFIWIAIVILAFMFALVYAFIKNSTIEEGLEKATEIEIVNKIVNSIW